MIGELSFQQLLQEGVSSAQKAVLEERQQEEEKVRTKLASLSTKLQQLSKEAVALVSVIHPDPRHWYVTVCADPPEGPRLSSLPPGQGETSPAMLQPNPHTLSLHKGV